MEKNFSLINDKNGGYVAVPEKNYIPKKISEAKEEDMDDESSVFNVLSSHLFKSLLPIPEGVMEAVDIHKEMSAGIKAKAPRPSLYKIGGVLINHPTMNQIAGYTERKKNEKKEIKANNEQPLYKIDRDRAAAKKIRY